MWKSLNAAMSMLKYPGPRTEPLLEVPKVLLAGTPKAQVPLSTPAVVQGAAEGSVPNQFALLRPDNLQRAVLVHAVWSVAVGIARAASNGLRKAGVGDDRCGEFPAADHFIHHAVGDWREYSLPRPTGRA